MGNGHIGIVCFFSWSREGERKKEREERERERGHCVVQFPMSKCRLSILSLCQRLLVQSVKGYCMYVLIFRLCLAWSRKCQKQPSSLSTVSFPCCRKRSFAASSASPHNMAKWCCQRLSNRRHRIDRLRRPATSSGEAGKRKDG